VGDQGGSAEREWLKSSELHGPAFEPLSDPPPRLILFGAVELAAALSRLGRALGWRSYVVDPRERYLTHVRFPDADGLLADWPSVAFDRLGGIDESTAVAVLTHDPVLDDPALVIALRSPAMFVGGMGSRRTQERRRARLMEEHGLTAEEVARLSGPIGLDLGARTAHETALSILGEIVAVAHGREGGRLRAGEGSIREARA
jgi:xanthine dehydrogenase accessory factor